ncbi:MAG: glycoside hydrolase [Burkholderiales bacterium]|nr:glycoside hydrolase [Burkholderiales bacterium]
MRERRGTTTPAASVEVEEGDLLETCRQKSVELLRTNLSPGGILAATPGARAESRGYAAIFGRDAAVCAIGMALSGDAVLEREAATGLVTLAGYQAKNGQIPKFVDVSGHEADFWYLGCIDATLWWLIALDFLDRRDPALGLRQRFGPGIAKAVQWLEAQEHQRFFLLQQNEASDWADIMPRSGFVLYTNALWYCVKQRYGLSCGDETRANFNQLFHPFSADLADYRRARLLAHYAKRKAKNRDLYLSFVNFSFYGEEGDVFGNLLALLCGLADGEAARRTLRALDRAGIADPWPVRVVCEPIPAGSSMWRAYMSRHRQNLEWQYHNGGIWPFVGGFWVVALVRAGARDRAKAELVKLAGANALDGWAFNEWLHGRTLAPGGMRGQSWNAAAFLIALDAVRGGSGGLFQPRQN